MSNWDIRYLKLARFIANEWSKDPSTKVGAVISDEYSLPVSLGVNGFPQGIADHPERLNNRDTKYKLVIHAERNAFIFAHRRLEGCTLYTYPIAPCSQCAAMFIQAKIARVVSTVPVSDLKKKEMFERWGKDLIIAEEMFKEAGIPQHVVLDIDAEIPRYASNGLSDIGIII